MATTEELAELGIGDTVQVADMPHMKRIGIAGLRGTIAPGGLCITGAVTLKIGEGVRLDLPRIAVELIEKYKPA